MSNQPKTATGGRGRRSREKSASADSDKRPSSTKTSRYRPGRRPPPPTQPRAADATDLAPADEPAWLRDLPTFDVDVPDFYQAAATRDLTVDLPANVKHARTVDRRRYLHMLNVANAAQHLDRLPARGESYHMIMKGNYNAWDLVPAVLRLAAPATISTLHVATLGFNRQNAAELLELLDTQQVAQCVFVCSAYYKSHEPEVFDWFVIEMAHRKCPVIAMRCHAKILLFEMTDQAAYVNESSANLRSCRNIEQCTFTNDAELLAFHRGWMDEILKAHHAKRPKTKAQSAKTTSRQPG